jgi:hypothetical protein
MKTLSLKTTLAFGKAECEAGDDNEIAQLSERFSHLSLGPPFGEEYSPFWRLPIELLRVIFLFCSYEDICAHNLHYNHVNDWPTSLNVRSPPWTLLRVCRRWRNVCGHYPLLWSIICIDVRETDYFGLLSLLGMQLFLSDTHPLSVVLRLPVNKAIRAHTLSVFMGALVSSASRWRLFALQCPDTDALLPFLAPLQKHLSGLTSVSLHQFSMKPVKAPDYKLFLQNATKVQEASLINLEPTSYDTLTKPWENLRTVLWGHIYMRNSQHMDSFVRSIRRMKKVVTMHVDFKHIHANYLRGYPIISMPLLRELKIVAIKIEGGVAEQLLDILSLPSLSILYVQQTTPCDLDSITRLVDRCRCTITNLTIQLPPHTLRLGCDALLESVPELTRFTLLPGCDAQSVSNVIDALTYSSAVEINPVLRLQVLHIHKSKNGTIDSAKLISMMESRRPRPKTVYNRFGDADRGRIWLREVLLGDRLAVWNADMGHRFQKLRSSTGFIFRDFFLECNTM